MMCSLDGTPLDNDFKRILGAPSSTAQIVGYGMRKTSILTFNVQSNLVSIGKLMKKADLFFCHFLLCFIKGRVIKSLLCLLKIGGLCLFV